METATELSVTLLTIKELLDKYAPNLIEKIEKLSDEGKIKTDGAIDEITNKGKKDIMPLHLARIIEEVQRVDAIEENKIIDTSASRRSRSSLPRSSRSTSPPPTPT